MNHLYRALCAIALLFSAGTAMAAGTLPLALSQTVDVNGRPLAGALLYTYVVGTVAQPQNSYQDTALTILNPWPLPADQNGRLPMFYLADGSTHVRLTDASGNVQYDNATVLVIGPSSGGGGGSSVDPTTILATGDLKVKYGTGAISGFVRANALTIGNITSGATERANADTQALFVYLYNADPNLVVSGGRTGNALNDYNSSKTITLPDWRGRAIAALDDMGNGAAGRLTATYFGTAATTLGAAGGSQTSQLVTLNLPPYTPSGTVSTTLSQTFLLSTGVGSTATTGNAFAGAVPTASSTFSGAPQGGTSTPFANVMPAMLATIYLKL